MPLTAGLVHQQEIQSAIQRVESKFAQQVDHVRYNLGENWIGAPSIFFRVVLRDDAYEMENLQDIAQNISFSLMNEAKTDEIGLYAYFDFRTLSEQEQMQDPAWA